MSPLAEFKSVDDIDILKSEAFQFIDKCGVFRETDSFLADRGYTRCKSKHEVIYPLSLSSGGNQLTTEEANYTRRVTRLRNAVERGYGRIKKWKLIADRINLSNVEHIHDFFPYYFRRGQRVLLVLFRDTEQSIKDGEIIVSRLQIENRLSNELVKRGWNIRHNTFESVSNQIQIPQLTDTMIREWSTGDYAVKLARAYIVNSGGTLQFHTNIRCPNILQIRGLQSRFKSKTHRTVYLRFPPGFNSLLPDVISLCNCKVGLRTVGGCAHAVACLFMIQYLQCGKEVPVFHLRETCKIR